MSIYQGRGEFAIKWYQKKASTALVVNTLATLDTSPKYLIPAVAGSTVIVGVILKKVASTDSIYADNSRVPVAIPKTKEAELVCDVGTGTIALTDEGKTFDLKDATSVDATADVVHQLRLKQFISSTKGVFTLQVPANV